MELEPRRLMSVARLSIPGIGIWSVAAGVTVPLATIRSMLSRLLVLCCRLVRLRRGRGSVWLRRLRCCGVPRRHPEVVVRAGQAVAQGAAETGVVPVVGGVGIGGFLPARLAAEGADAAEVEEGFKEEGDGGEFDPDGEEVTEEYEGRG